MGSGIFGTFRFNYFPLSCPTPILAKYNVVSASLELQLTYLDYVVCGPSNWKLHSIIYIWGYFFPFIEHHEN